jgi:predicted MPP superfamily phosphohydrolase
MIYRCVHISDLHFGQSSGPGARTQDDVRRKLLEDSRALASVRGNASYVLATGDIAFSGKQTEYAAAAAWLRELTAASGCPTTHVLTVPGNHDCDRTQIGAAGKMVHKHIREAPMSSMAADLASVASEPDDRNQLMPKLRAYQDFAGAYGCDFVSPAEPYWKRDVSLGDGLILRFVGLTTVLISDALDSEGNLVLGQAQYLLDDASDVITIAMLHHPLGWLRDRVEAESYLHNRARVLMMGHEHRLAINKVSEIGGAEWIEVFSGATNPPEITPVYDYRYNWLEFSTEAIGERQYLSVRVFPRLWSSSRACFIPDSNRLGGVEDREMQLCCPYVRVVQRRDNTSELSELLPGGSQATGDTAPTTFTEPAMNGNDEEAFARLRYLFWTELTWQQRLKVLVAADVLPQTTVRPIPQTMEKLALSSARSAGRLGDLWDAVMANLPEARRQPNPYR